MSCFWLKAADSLQIWCYLNVVAFSLPIEWDNGQFFKIVFFHYMIIYNLFDKFSLKTKNWYIWKIKEKQKIEY